MKTAFQKIALFNTLIGNANESDLDGLEAQFECIREEFEEMAEALQHMRLLANGDHTPEELGGIGYSPFAALRDGIADVLVTTYGLAHRAGIDADADLDAVSESNMSKFIFAEDTESQNEFDIRVADEMADLDKRGLEYEFNETAPNIWAFTSKHDHYANNGKFFPKGKLLKPTTYKEPVFVSKFERENKTIDMFE